MNTKETTYVVSVLHIGVRYIDLQNRGGSVNTKDTTPRMLSVCCTLVCIIYIFLML